MSILHQDLVIMRSNKLTKFDEYTCSFQNEIIAKLARQESQDLNLNFDVN